MVKDDYNLFDFNLLIAYLYNQLERTATTSVLASEFIMTIKT